MDAVKHTPAPWWCKESGARLFILHRSTTRGDVGYVAEIDCRGRDGGRPTDQDRADGRLIALAPQMRELLDLIVYGQDCDMSGLRVAAEELLRDLACCEVKP